MPEFEKFCGINFCGWAKMKKISIHTVQKFMKHFIKIFKLTNYKMNECHFIVEKWIHIKMHAIKYHLYYSYRRRFQKHCRLDPHRPPLLTLSNKCHRRPLLLSLLLGGIPQRNILHTSNLHRDIVLFKTYVNLNWIYFWNRSKAGKLLMPSIHLWWSCVPLHSLENRTIWLPTTRAMLLNHLAAKEFLYFVAIYQHQGLCQFHLHVKVWKRNCKIFRN